MVHAAMREKSMFTGLKESAKALRGEPACSVSKIVRHCVAEQTKLGGELRRGCQTGAGIRS